MNILKKIKTKFFEKKSNQKIKAKNNNKVDGTYLKSNEINSFEIRNKDISISFEKIPDNPMIDKLHPFILTKQEQDDITGTLSMIIAGSVNTKITSMATRGLFKATADPATLMKLSDGSLGSAVMKNGKISKQSGFLRIGSRLFTPMLIFQFTSIITGHYYMKNIGKQLNLVQSKLDELINLFHIERQAKLIKSYQEIQDYLTRKNFVTEDFMYIKLLLSQISDIREEYYLMLENLVNDIKKNNQYHNFFNSEEEAKKIASDFKESNFLEKMQVALVADELYHLAKMAEFHMNLCYKNPDINRINCIYDKFIEISNFNSDKLLFNKTNQLYNEVKADTLKWINYSEEQSWLWKDEIKEIRMDIKQEFEEFEVLKNKKFCGLEASYKSLIKPFTDEKTIIIDNRTENGKIYIE